MLSDNGFERGYPGFGGLASGPVEHEDDIMYGQFADDFIWSSATAAYQVEGGWDEDGMSFV